MVRIAVTAPRGAMGSLIIHEGCKSNDIRITGCIGSPGSEYIGRDAGIVSGYGEEIGVPVVDDLEKVIEDCDIVVDFSTVAAGMKILDICCAHGKGLICGTTGFSDAERKRFSDAGDMIPLMMAANTSYVVNVMRKIVGIAAEKLGDRCDIDIIEVHSRTKKDAPSGTALEIGSEIAEKSGKKGDLEYHSLRSGNTPSEHRVVFGCMGEKMEISHEAFDWRCYASGACDAAVYMGEIMQNSPDGGVGLYTIDDVIGI